MELPLPKIVENVDSKKKQLME